MTPSTKNRVKLWSSLIFLGLFIILILASGFITLLMNDSLSSNRDQKYSIYSNYSGDPLNTTIHQSILEQGNPLVIISDASDIENNTFSIASPNDRKFSKTNQEIIVDGIYAPNKTKIYEDESGVASSLDALLDSRLSASFRIEGSGYLINTSIYLSNIDNSLNGNLTLQVFNSSWDNINGRSEPDSQYGNDLKTGVEINNNFDDWYTFTNFNFFLDILQTDNNTFFLVLNDANDDTNWAYIRDVDGPPPKDDSDDLYCYEEIGQDWILYGNGKPVDFFLKSDFAPKSHFPNATDIYLAINNKSVADFGERKGIWKNNELFDTLPDSLDFTISANWWDVSCNITKILVNYTRTDLEAAVSYFFDENDQAVQWNATLGSFNGFDSDFGNYWINFTVPKSWENITVYNASELILNNPTFGALRNGYRELQIRPASNGSNWYITAEVNRLKTNIDILYKPNEVVAGDEFQLRFYVSLINGSDIIPFQDVVITVEVFVNGESIEEDINSTDDSGIIGFRILIPSDTNSLFLTVDLPGTISYTSTFFQINDITVSNASESSNSPIGIDLSGIIPIFIIIGSIAGSSIIIGSFYKIIIIPKRETQKNTLKKIRNVFDDAINMEYILVIYKESGVSIFFKSMGLENVDPDLISGFISAISSFGEKIELNESLTKMKYGDKSLLLADGKYIRVGIVLNDKGSELIRENLKKFTEEFEERYADTLPKWESSLMVFKDAGDLVDKIFNTSIILPHIVKYNISDIKDLQYNISRNILYEAESLLEEPNREYFFIGKLLNRVQEETKKEIGEIFLGIRELREKGLLIPLELSEIGEEGKFCRNENKKVLRTIFQNKA